MLGMLLRQSACAPFPSGSPLGDSHWGLGIGSAPLSTAPPVENSEGPIRCGAADQAVLGESFPRFEVGNSFRVDHGRLPRATAFASQDAGWHTTRLFYHQLLFKLAIGLSDRCH